MASATYPLDSLTFDTVTTGAYTDIIVGQTLLLGSAAGLDDLGRTRVRAAPTATTIPVGRSSRGTRDGELDVSDNVYITIVDDFRVWSKIPFIDSTGVQYKDSALTVGTNTTTPPPVANAGVPAMGTIDATTGKFSAWLPHVANTSFAVADGATITGYQWFLPTGVTLDAGSVATDSAILVDCAPGFYWIALTVTDSNGKTHTARTFVFARDPDADVTIPFEIVSHRWMRQGQLISVRVLEDIPAITYPDGTLVVIMDGEPLALPDPLTDRSNVLFWGWHQTDPAEIGATRTGTLAGTVLECVDVAGRLDSLPGFSVVVYNDAKRDTTANPAITWSYMTTPHVDKLLHHLLYWHSTALEVADWTWSGTTTTFPFTVLEAGGESIFDQVNRKAQALMPDHYLVCDRLGRMAVRVDPMLQDAADRTATIQGSVLTPNWEQIRYTGQRPPRVHWLEGSAILADAAAVTAVFCKAPGNAPGQGETNQTHGEQLALTQAQLNAVTGHRYARLNAPQSQFRITPAGYAFSLLDPAAMTWVEVSIDAATAAQRGLTFALARGLVHEMVIRYEHTRTGTVREATLLWERETEGTPAVTVVPADALPVDDGNDYWYTPPADAPFDNGLRVGEEVIAAIGLYHLYRTTDYQTPSGSGGPTWSSIDMTKTLALSEGVAAAQVLSWVVDPFSPGYRGTGTEINGWAVTGKYVLRLEDIFGTLVVTTAHTFAVAIGVGGVTYAGHEQRSVQASFGRYQEVESDNPWLMVVSHYSNKAGHTGTWAIYSVDAGVTWSSEIQISAHYVNDAAAGVWARRIGVYLSPKTPGLVYSTAYTSTAAGGSITSDGFVSTDWGATWSAISDPDILPGNSLAGDIHVPWPTNDDEDIVYHGYLALSGTAQARLKRVTGATVEDISPSDGTRLYGVNANGFQIRTYDSNRIYVVVNARGQDTGASVYNGVWISDDAGDTWTEIFAPFVITSSEIGFGVAFSGTDPNVLFIWGGYVNTTNPIFYTSNFGVTLDSRKGNLQSLIDGDVGAELFVGICGGPLA